MRKLLFSVIVLILAVPALAAAQSQSDEKVLVGHVQSIHPSGTEITLTDGTTLLTPPGVRIQPGMLEQGTAVVAGYREQENGNKILTKLLRGPSEPSPATPGASPKPTR